MRALNRTSTDWREKLPVEHCAWKCPEKNETRATLRRGFGKARFTLDLG